MYPYIIDYYVLETLLTSEDCCERLRQTLAASRKTTWFGISIATSPIDGRVSAGGFSIVKRQRARNDWRPIARGRFEDLSGGARCTVYVAPAFPIAVITLLITVLCGILAAVVAMQLLLAKTGQAETSGVELALFAFVLAIAVLGQRTIGAQQELLLHVLHATLEAREVRVGRVFVLRAYTRA